MINNKIKILIVFLFTCFLIYLMIYLGMIPNPLDKYNTYSEKKKIEKQGINNYLDDLDSGKYDDYLFEEDKKIETVKSQNNSNINTYGTGNQRLEKLFSVYDNFGINDELIEYYSDLSTTNIEYILNSENQKGKEKFAKITVDLLSYLKENRNYFNDTKVVEYDFITGEAEVKRLYAREYYNYIKNIKNSNDNQAIDEAKIELEKLKTITKEINLKSKNYEIVFNQFIFDENLNYSKKVIYFKIDLEKILINYGE